MCVGIWLVCNSNPWHYCSQRKLLSIVKDLKEHPDIQEIYDVLQEYTNENQADDTDEDAESPVSPNQSMLHDQKLNI